jgi:hypothetical protein
MLTDRSFEYTPPAGLKVGVAAVPATVAVYSVAAD